MIYFLVNIHYEKKGSDFLTYQDNTTIFKQLLNILKIPKDLQLSK